MRNIFFLFALFLSHGVLAQVGISRENIHRLKALVKQDHGVKTIVDTLIQDADQALKDDANPRDTIRTEGLLQGDPRKTLTWETLKDMHKVYALAFAYRFTGKRDYLNQAAVYLIDWAEINGSRGDPIDDTNLDPAIEAYDMIKGDLVYGENQRIIRWFRQTAEAEINAPYNRPDRVTSHSNWHSHRLKIIGEIAFAIGDTTLQAYAINGIKEQISRNLLPDGSSEDFAERDALHYHVYDLEPLLKLAIVLKKATGVDYYAYQAPSGSSIKKSVEWLLPYLDGRQTHPEFVHSTVEFDRQRGRNGEAAYKTGTLFDPKNGVATLLLAGYFDGSMVEQARRLAGSGDAHPGWQAVLDELVRR